jgi:hypothetical protein
LAAPDIFSSRRFAAPDDSLDLSAVIVFARLSHLT